MRIIRRPTFLCILFTAAVLTTVPLIHFYLPPEYFRVFWAASAVIVLLSSLAGFLVMIRTLRLEMAKKTGQLIENERLLSTLMGNLPGIAYRRANTPDGTMKIISQGCLGLTGYRPEEMRATGGVRFTDLIHPDDYPMVSGVIDGQVAAGQRFRLQYRMRTKSGEEKWVLEQGGGVVGSDGRSEFVEGFILDITGRTETERLRIERDAAKAASRTKSDFLANIGHEIRTPLNAILGFSQILKAQLGDERLQQYIHAITTSGNTLLRLINDLLDLSKIESGKFELKPTAVDLQRLVREIRLVFMPAVDEKRLEFVIDLDPALPDSLIIDDVRLRQILFNLLKNAFKFTDRGRIFLAMKAVDRARSGLVDLEITVADTGVGIPPEDQETIFEAFTQRKRQDQAKYAGTGLGLSITRRLVEIIGGEISLHSEVGKGSTFTVVLHDIPVAEGDLRNRLRGMNDEMTIRFDVEAVILVIDAVDSDRMLIREFLRTSRLSIVETISIADGIEWCMAVKPDLILLDYTMTFAPDPELVLRFNRVKEELNIPVVVATSAAGVGSDEFRTNFHFDGWLAKPLLFLDVMQTLARFLPHSSSCGGDDAPFTDTREGYVLPDPREVRRSLAGLKDRLPVLRRILVDNLLEQWKEIGETCIINEMKTFAEEIQRMSTEYELDFLAVWARLLLGQIRIFDMERLPETFNLFAELVGMIELCSRPVPVAADEEIGRFAGRKGA